MPIDITNKEEKQIALTGAEIEETLLQAHLSKDAISKIEGLEASASEIDGGVSIISDLMPLDDIVCWGDSLTEGVGFNGGFTTQLKNTLGRVVRNEGIGGQTSTQIAARQGGQPLTISIVGNAIPSKTIEATERCTNGAFDSDTSWLRHANVTILNGKCVINNVPYGANAIYQSVPLNIGDVIQVSLKMSNYISGALTFWLGGAQTKDANKNFIYIDDDNTTIVETTVPSGYNGYIIFGSNNRALTCTIDDVSIKKTNSVITTISSKNINILYSSGVYSGIAMANINGADGLLTTDLSGNWSFVRYSDGAAIPTVENEIVELRKSISYIKNTMILWAGRNDSRATRTDIVAIRDNIISAVDNITCKVNSYLVLGITNASTEIKDSTNYLNIIEANRELKEYFGNNFIDVRSYLVNRAIYDAGITPTAQDLTDISNDVIPSSLRFDSVHINTTAHVVLGKMLANIIKARKY